MASRFEDVTDSDVAASKDAAENFFVKSKTVKQEQFKELFRVVCTFRKLKLSVQYA